MEFLVQNWQQAFDDCFALASQIKNSDFRPDLIIGIARGGWIPARLVADFLHMKETVNIKIETYQTIDQEELTPEITQEFSTKLQGKKVLLVDDVADSGVTLAKVIELAKHDGAKEIKSAVLYYKPRSSILPDYYVTETSAWVLFSWSTFESIEDLHTKWLKEGMTTDEIQMKLKKIGLPIDIVDSYFLVN